MRKELRITKPNDFHLHLRSDDILKEVIKYSVKDFCWAIIMPNLDIPLTTIKLVEKYYAEILQSIPANCDFQPLMTLYLKQDINFDDLKKAKSSNFIIGGKLYPDGATTNSRSGISDLETIMPIFEEMSKLKLNLLIHGETGQRDIDIFDREAHFIDNFLIPLTTRLPDLNITLEHITTKYAVDYILSAKENVVATITPHHLLLDRNHLLADGIKPHYYCKPILKRQSDNKALIKAATSGDQKFFLGTDSAPHLTRLKQAKVGCAGVFCAINAISCIAQIFDNEDALQQLENFTSINGANFYKLSISSAKIKLIKTNEAQIYPEYVKTKSGDITIFQPQKDIFWQVA